MKSIYISDIKGEDNISGNFMIMKKLFSQKNLSSAYLGDKTGDLKFLFKDSINNLEEGMVLKVSGSSKDGAIQVNSYEILKNFLLEDYLRTIERPIEDIMKEIEQLSNDTFKDKRCLALNDYFFKDTEFLEKFKYGIGGINQHHNYRGGLAEHTLNVMHLTKYIGEKYKTNNLEIAVLGAKLHDIGKVYEYIYDRPFQTTLEGDMEGHIVIGINLLSRAFSMEPNLYDKIFMERIKEIIAQHHGKVEYGSPKVPNTEEAYLVSFADNIDALLNKIDSIKKGVKADTYAPYDKRLDTRLFV